MRLFAIFLILNIQLTHIFAYPPDSSELSSQANYKLKGYECGDVFFTYSEVREVVSTARSYIDKGYQYPQIYRGKLYIDSEYKDYFLYPIKKGNLFRAYNDGVSLFSPLPFLCLLFQ